MRLVLKRFNKSLYDIVKSAMPFTAQQRLECMDQIEAAVAHLHVLGLAHNDISPSNTMLDNLGQAILIDLDSCATLGSPRLPREVWLLAGRGLLLKRVLN